MWSAWWILWALTCQIHVVVGKHQAAISSSMNNFETNHMVRLPTSKLNSSDAQVLGAGIFLSTSTREAHSCLVQECYDAIVVLGRSLGKKLRMSDLDNLQVLKR
jgi:uncharacterized protein YlxW (UPF0749 family)